MNKKEVKAKLKHHRKKVRKLEKKLDEIREDEKKIGFKYGNKWQD